jgi:hypothetical protein
MSVLIVTAENYNHGIRRAHLLEPVPGVRAASTDSFDLAPTGSAGRPP